MRVEIGLIRVRLLGHLKTLFNSEEIEMKETRISVKDILRRLEKLGPQGGGLSPGSLLVAVNGVEASTLGGTDVLVGDGDIVTIIPVVHGG